MRTSLRWPQFALVTLPIGDSLGRVRRLKLHEYSAHVLDAARDARDVFARAQKAAIATRCHGSNPLKSPTSL